jgi:phosphonate transport system substrate-binding protein
MNFTAAILWATLAAPATNAPAPAVGTEVDVHGVQPVVVADQSKRPLRVGVVAVLGTKSNKDGPAFARFLGAQLGKPVEPVTFKDYDQVATAVVDEEIDIAWMPPLQGFNAKLGGATVPAKLTRGGQGSYRSVLFARADAPYSSLAAVKGARVAWVERNSATGYLFPLALISKTKLEVATLFKTQEFLGNHEAVCEAVVKGKVDIGATLADEPPAGTPLSEIDITGCREGVGPKTNKLKVLAISDPVPNDVLVLRKGIDAGLRVQLEKLALGLAQSKDGAKLLHDVFHADGTAAAAETDFEPVARALEAASTTAKK